jgi:hypothetical protein
LPAPLPPLLAWVDKVPYPLIQAVAQWADGGAPSAIRHLLACDREHRREDPAELPVIEETAERLFAHRPGLAMIQAMYCEGVRIAADMSDGA